MEKIFHSTEVISARCNVDFQKKCSNCAYSMPSVNSSSGLRCGHSYFMMHPILRKMNQMDQYKEIDKFHVCYLWSAEVRDGWRGNN
jgi:hypothetical protein